MVADRFYAALRPRYPAIWEARLPAVMRMMVELSYAASEMVLEEPDRDAELINNAVCLLFALYFENLR